MYLLHFSIVEGSWDASSIFFYSLCSEHTTRWTLKQMDYSSRRPHRVPLLSAKNRKRRLQFAQAHQNWTIEDCKNVAWSDESWFLLRHSDGRVRIWRKEHESMDPSCLVSTVQAGGRGVVVWGIFSWHTLCPLVPIEHRLNATDYLSIVADHVHPFMTTVYTSSDDTSSIFQFYISVSIFVFSNMLIYIYYYIFL